MTKINIKPLSVNDCWQGRRFKTKKYKAYEEVLLMRLKPIKIPEPPLTIKIEFGFSTSLADIDNPIKPFLDILQKKYKFNDRDIYQLNISKKVVGKGLEYIDYNIKKA